jgi:predicted amidohydrolase YtcJ
MRSFNRAGFTHIRDMTCRTNQWNEALHLDESGLLTLAVEIFFGTLNGTDFQTVLKEAIAASKVQTKSLRVKGVKVFADGALGSEGALLSRCYCSGSGHGLSLLADDDELEQAMKLTWQAGLRSLCMSSAMRPPIARRAWRRNCGMRAHADVCIWNMRKCSDLKPSPF